MEYFAGIDIGGTEIKIGLVSSDGDLISKRTIKTPDADTLNNFFVPIVETYNGILKELKLDKNDIKAVGVGMPGLSDSKSGDLIYCPSIKVLTDLGRIPFTKSLSEKLGVKVFIGSDAKNACLAELTFGALKGEKRNALFLTIGTGIGGTPVYDGKIIPRSVPGHTVFSYGTFTEYGSTKALIDKAKVAAKLHPDSLINKEFVEANKEDKYEREIDGRVFLKAYLKGDLIATKVYNDWIKNLADGIASLVDITGTEVVVIGGGISNLGKVLINPLRKRIQERIFYNHDKAFSIDVKSAKFTNDAGIIGSAVMASNRMREIENRMQEIEKISQIRRIKLSLTIAARKLWRYWNAG